MMLLIEDDPDDELFMEMALKDSKIDCELAIARDGVEALEYLLGDGKPEGRGRGPLPTLILLDLNLPKMNGVELLRHIRSHEHTRIIPVVVMTSSSRDQDMIDCYSLSANSYIQKPIDFNEFVDVVQRLFTYWLKLNKTPGVLK